MNDNTEEGVQNDIGCRCGHYIGDWGQLWKVANREAEGKEHN